MDFRVQEAESEIDWAQTLKAAELGPNLSSTTYY